MRNIVLRLGFATLLLCALVVSASAVTLQPSPIGPCKNSGIQCLDVWDPVICDNGQIYSNLCYAKRACATGCVPLGGGPTS
ncbi:MAG TPA: hypothetical protein VLU25_16555 [Acidobacteriota bacterium]|nr:hypothetical protein [Acidobacteriota bacterium]